MEIFTTSKSVFEKPLTGKLILICAQSDASVGFESQEIQTKVLKIRRCPACGREYPTAHRPYRYCSADGTALVD